MNRLCWIGLCAVILALVAGWPVVADDPKPEDGVSDKSKPKEAAVAEETVTEEMGGEEGPSHYEHLKPLEWMVGTWELEEKDASVTTTCRWTKNRNFLTLSFKIVTADDRELEGTQIIGWDPIKKEIRSWMFDSEGGFGQGKWTKDGDRWISKVSQVLAGGKRAAAVNVMTRVDDDSYTWQSINREVDGEMLPSGPKVTLARRKAEQ